MARLRGCIHRVLERLEGSQALLMPEAGLDRRVQQTAHALEGAGPRRTTKSMTNPCALYLRIGGSWYPAWDGRALSSRRNIRLSTSHQSSTSCNGVCRTPVPGHTSCQASALVVQPSCQAKYVGDMQPGEIAEIEEALHANHPHGFPYTAPPP